MSRYSRANIGQFQKDMSHMTAAERFTARQSINPDITREHSNQLDTWDASVKINEKMGYGSARAQRSSTAAPRASTAARTTARYSNIGLEQYTNAYNDGEDKRVAYNLRAQEFAKDEDGNFHPKIHEEYKIRFPSQYNPDRQGQLRVRAKAAKIREDEEDGKEDARQLRKAPKWEFERQNWLYRPMTEKQKRDKLEETFKYHGGYAKLTKMGLLARIMNIKKKATKAAKPVARKPAKPVKPVARKPAKPAKPTRPVRRRNPTIVRRKA